jgi:hypothetical protein
MGPRPFFIPTDELEDLARSYRGVSRAFDDVGQRVTHAVDPLDVRPELAGLTGRGYMLAARARNLSREISGDIRDIELSLGHAVSGQRDTGWRRGLAIARLVPVPWLRVVVPAWPMWILPTPAPPTQVANRIASWVTGLLDHGGTQTPRPQPSGGVSLPASRQPETVTLPALPHVVGPQAVRGAEIVRKALAEVGTRRPTGWNAPGECIVSVRRWVNDAGGKLTGPGVTESYKKAGAVEVPLSDIQPGDIIQFHAVGADANTNWDHAHTVLVTGNNDGRISIVQSNSPEGSGLVTTVDPWTPSAREGWAWTAFRIGQS